MLTLSKQFPPPFTQFPSKSHHSPCRSLTLGPLKASAAGGGGNGVNNDGNDTPPSTAGIRFRRGSRKLRRQKQQEEELGFGDGGVAIKAKMPPKEWESMSLSEKATEMYMGEKGLLFWLNKFAYASIFIVIGGWIVFRFVGPALNLYQLEAPPLAPDSILKGS